MLNFILFSLLGACTSETTNPDAPKKESKSSFQDLDMDALQKAAEKATVNLVPPPLELQKALVDKGLKSDLSSFVAKKNLSMDIDDTDQIAIRAGVLISDLVFTIKTAPISDLTKNLDSLRIAFDKLKAGDDIGSTIDDLKDSLSRENPDREKILEEMNDLSMVMVSELKYEAGEWVVPLIQAGSWLEGSYIISSAILKEQNQEATELLKKPGTAKYFLHYVNREGRTKAPPIVIKKLSATLIDLDTISDQKSITMDDVQKVQSLTGELLKLL